MTAVHSSSERDTLILSLAPQVKAIVTARYRFLPRMVDRDDLTSAAWLGAIDAVDRFEPVRGLLLMTFAKWRINGAIQDFLRGLDPLSRDHRAQVTRGEAFDVGTISMDQPMQRHDDFTLHCILSDLRPERDQQILEARLTLDSLRKRARLNRRSNALLEGYLKGETLLAIAGTLGVGQPRVSQIHMKAIRDLRAAA